MSGAGGTGSSAETLRQEMVARQIAARGVRDPRVLRVMARIPRERFVPSASLGSAYGDHPLSIGWGQTLSQPYMVARMTELLAPQASDPRILEIGAGSGYQTAILASLVAHVVAVERLPELSERGRANLEALGIRNVSWHTGDGTLGWEAEGPYRGILVAAGAPSVPGPLLAQLSPGGRLVIPVGGRAYQELLVVTRSQDGGVQTRRDTLCRFVDLVGAHGWPPDPR